MGTIEHQLTVITATDYEGQDARVGRTIELLKEEMPAKFAALIVGPVPAVINGYVFWVMLPDGSKEGWEDSQEGEVWRLRFARLDPYNDAVTIRWGDYDEDGVTRGEFYPIDLVEEPAPPGRPAARAGG